jgi:uncharacterized protein (UPF0276 family)
MSITNQTVLSSIPKLGAGIGFRDQLKAELFQNRDKVDWLEITADHFMDASSEKDRELELLIQHFTLIPHGLNLSLGSAEGIDPAYVRKFAKIVERISPPYWSEHIAFTHAGGVEIGHLSPMPFTYEALDVLTKNINTAREYIDLPLILENITYIVEMPSDMNEAKFLTELVNRTGCGLLLDVTNLYTNAVNHGYDLDAFLADAPLESVVQLHFTGGEYHGDILIDSHSSATPDEVWELLDKVVAISPVKGVLLERDEKIPPFSELEPELVRAREIGRKHGRWA